MDFELATANSIFNFEIEKTPITVKHLYWEDIFIWRYWQ